MGAENICDVWGITRQELDEFGASSQQKAEAAIKSGRFDDEIVPVMVKQKKQMVEFKVDEFPRAGVTAEGISKLKGAFPVGPEGVEDQIVHTFQPTEVHEADAKKHVQRVTAANASGINDGAAAIVLASGEAVEKYGLKPMAKLVSWGQGGVDPKIMGVGPVIASRNAMAKAGVTVDDIDLVEANEAFAAQSIAVARELGFDMEKVNVNGGAISIGRYLKREGVARIVRYSNQGVSGLTTTDFLPETGTYFEKVRAAADQFRDESWATLLFSIMLGTNDSATRGPNGAPLAPDAYAANLQRIVDRLLALYPSAKIVLHRPIWYSPNTYNRSEYLQAGLDRLTAYYPALRALVQDYEKRFPGQVFLGDTLGYTVFRDEAEALFQPEQGQAGVFRLHPNREGAVRLGELWGAAIRRALELKTKEDLEQE